MAGRNSKIQLGFAAAATVLAAVLRFAAIEWAILALTIGLVLAMEAMNTAVERSIDLVSPDYHPLAGRVKDLAAGAVLIASITAAIVGAILFLPKILRHL